jgi:hypothetical protein
VSSYFPHSAESIVIGPAFPLTAAQAAPPPFSTSPPVSTILVGGKAFNSAAFTSEIALLPGGRCDAMCCGVLEPGKLMWRSKRQFQLTEKVGLRFRGEFFNLFNHPNLGPADNNLTDALFGQSTQTLASSLGSGGANGGFNPPIRSVARARSNWHSTFNSEQPWHFSGRVGSF